jgi:hypothetical protein
MGTLQVVEDVFVGLAVVALFALVELSATTRLTGVPREDLQDGVTDRSGDRGDDRAAISNSP